MPEVETLVEKVELNDPSVSTEEYNAARDKGLQHIERTVEKKAEEEPPEGKPENDEPPEDEARGRHKRTAKEQKRYDALVKQRQEAIEEAGRERAEREKLAKRLEEIESNSRATFQPTERLGYEKWAEKRVAEGKTATDAEYGEYYADWRDQQRAEKAKFDAEQAKTLSVKARLDDLDREGREAYTDWESVVLEGLKTKPLSLRLQQTMIDEVENIPEVLHEIYTDKKLYEKLKSMTPARADALILEVSEGLAESGDADNNDEEEVEGVQDEERDAKGRFISKAPPPIRATKGTSGTAQYRSLAEAMKAGINIDEYNKLRDAGLR